MVPVGAGIVALGLLAVLLSVAGGRDDGEQLPVWSAVEVSGTPLPAFDRSGRDRALGLKAPVARGSGFDGRHVAIAPTGRPQIVLFLAHWCPHCRNEVPELVRWADEHGMPAGVDFVSVSTWADAQRPNFPPGAWLRRERWTVPTLVDDRGSSVGEAFGLRGTPFWVFLDADGIVLARLEAELGGAGLERVLGSLTP
jgi:thiol-disulfide isomerase/thioredoxin